MVRSNLVHQHMNRRLTLLQLLAAAAVPAWGAKTSAAIAPGSALSQAIARLESCTGGRLGAAVIDEKGVVANYRSDERFALCSTFKLAWPPGRPPLLMAVYFERTGYPTEENARVLAAVGAMIGGARFSDSMANPAAAL